MFSVNKGGNGGFVQFFFFQGKLVAQTVICRYLPISQFLLVLLVDKTRPLQDRSFKCVLGKILYYGKYELF